MPMPRRLPSTISGGRRWAFVWPAAPVPRFGFPHVLVNTLLSSLADGASAFKGAVAVAGGSSVGAPSVAVDDDGDFAAGFTVGNSTREVGGTETTVGQVQTLGAAGGDPALATLDPDGGGATVWPGVDGAGRQVVDVRDTLPGGGYQAASLSAPISGPISSLSIGPSGQGDALIVFEQGLSSTSQVAVATVQSPPHRFFAFTPPKWVKPAGAIVTWTRPRT